MNNNIKTYERIQTEGLNQKQLIVMMYDGIIRFLKEAGGSIEKENFDEAHQRFDRARKIVFHLLSTLNLEAGEIAEKLKALYIFLIEKITEANLKKERRIIEELIPIVENIKSGWEGIQLNDDSIPEDKRKLDGKQAQQVSITV
jgi:flagellar protein FliS